LLAVVGKMVIAGSRDRGAPLPRRHGRGAVSERGVGAAPALDLDLATAGRRGGRGAGRGSLYFSMFTFLLKQDNQITI
jgi:hypothetical protein